MASTTITDNRGKLLADLKRYVAAKATAAREVEGLTIKIWTATYAYCEAHVALGGASSVSDACLKLSGAVKSSSKAVEGWYYNGKFMREHGITQEARATAVVVVRDAFSGLSPSERARALLRVKAGGTRGELVRLCAKSRSVRVRDEVRRVLKLDRDNKITKTTMKMEMMAWQTFAAAFFGQEVSIEVKDLDGNTLMKAGGG